jgi:predicted RNase H-like nuclease (RuvC/YqgF family)
MESKHHNSNTFYKQLEEELNKRIHQNTNCPAFTAAFGKSVDHHLDKVLISRRLMAKRLKRLDLPNKDEFVQISVRLVDYEEKLDELEDNLYLLNKQQNKNIGQIENLKESLKALHLEIETEVRDLQARKIKSLENELEDLKQLFNK